MTGWKDPEPIHEDVRDVEDVSDMLDARTIEQVRHQVNILEEIYANAFMKKRLVLGGANALLYVHFESVPRIITRVLTSGMQMTAIPRVTSDIDGDYHIPHQGIIYEDDRKEFESKLHDILVKHGNLQIRENDRSFNLDIKYRGDYIRDGTFKVEINFMRRIPVLGYIEGTFKDPVSDRTFPVKTYPKEQAFANKWRTMVSRNKSSDIFDVCHISQADFNREEFMRCAVLECMLELRPQGEPDPTGGDILQRVLGLDVDKKVKNMFSLEYRPKVYKGSYSVDDLKSMSEPVIEFSHGILVEMTDDDKAAIERFFTDRDTAIPMLIREVLEMIDPDHIFSPMVHEHPQLHDQLQRFRSDSKGI